MSRTAFVMIGLLLWLDSSDAAAQPRWDIAPFGGLVAARAPVEPQVYGYREDWFHTGEAGLTIGRYLTPHVKVEIEAAATGTGLQFVQRSVTVPGRPYPATVGAEAETSFRWIGAQATYQFFDNQWVHPFLSAGVAAQFERRGVRVWEQNLYLGDVRNPDNVIPLAVDGREGPVTTTRVSGVVSAGAKLYVTERAFFRTEARIAASPRSQTLSFRAGFGIDF